MNTEQSFVFICSVISLHKFRVENCKTNSFWTRVYQEFFACFNEFE